MSAVLIIVGAWILLGVLAGAFIAIAVVLIGRRDDESRLGDDVTVADALGYPTVPVWLARQRAQENGGDHPEGELAP
jgi:hypothetical protein